MKILFILYFLLAGINSIAQISIKGKTIWYANNQPISGINLFTTKGSDNLENTDSVSYFQTDSGGWFNINVEYEGPFDLNFLAIGFVPFTITNIISQNSINIDLDTVYLIDHTTTHGQLIPDKNSEILPDIWTYSNDYFDEESNQDSLFLVYPPNAERQRMFRLKNRHLYIEHIELLKE
ncbi:hypothetical protein HZR84_09960 [Hyphobacterium sp. CCMP332]|nr:hypothetical protein HZR84_09960 [Hyphobacterium sp. CCMP332]